MDVIEVRLHQCIPHSPGWEADKILRHGTGQVAGGCRVLGVGFPWKCGLDRRPREMEPVGRLFGLHEMMQIRRAVSHVNDADRISLVEDLPVAGSDAVLVEAVQRLVA